MVERVTQLVQEALIQSANANVRSTQLVQEALIQTVNANVRSTQLVLQVLRTQTRTGQTFYGWIAE